MFGMVEQSCVEATNKRLDKAQRAKDYPPILIVEDNLVVRKYLETMLRKAGYPVEIVSNGRQGLAAFERGFFPIVVTDWVMPEMDGIEFCKTLRCHEFPGYVYVILLTGKDSKAEIIAGLESGADDYVTKPIHPAELIARLNTGKRIIELERSLRKRNEEMALFSITEPLTNVYNRGYLNRQLPFELTEACRRNRCLSVIMCDIDHFKRVNDLYGHQIGDLVLKEFAECLRGAIRDGYDWLARYGGEEFVVVLPETGQNGALRAAERYRHLVSEMVISSAVGPIKITASFGVASFHPCRNGHETTMESLIADADRCLYRAKQAGRNRVKAGGSALSRSSKEHTLPQQSLADSPS